MLHTDSTTTPNLHVGKLGRPAKAGRDVQDMMRLDYVAVFYAQVIWGIKLLSLALI